MKGYLGEVMSSFDGIRQSHVRCLLFLVSEMHVPTVEQVRRRYTDHAECFDETLAFLLGIGAVTEKEGLLNVMPVLEEAPSLSEDAIRKLLLALLATSDTCYRHDLFSYLSVFRVTNGVISHRPCSQDRSDESGIRNYLLDLRIISFDRDSEAYAICPEHLDLFVEACRMPRRMSPRQLESRLRQQDLLGRRTEEAIVHYERTRLGESYSHHVRHVAIEDVAAGYDILSATVGPDGSITPRYIEVKAVPAQTLRFFLSANEIAVAEALGSCYYLYLVPVNAGGLLDAEDVRVIADPHTTVLNNQAEWLVETNGIRCSMALNGPDDTRPDDVTEDG